MFCFFFIALNVRKQKNLLQILGFINKKQSFLL